MEDEEVKCVKKWSHQILSNAMHSYGNKIQYNPLK